MMRKARCYGNRSLHCAVPISKDTWSCCTRCEVARTILSQPRRTRLPRKAGANPGKRFPLLWLYQLVFRDHLPFRGSCVNLAREINYCSRPSTIRSEGVQRAGSSPRVIAGALLACNVPDAAVCRVPAPSGCCLLSSCVLALYIKAALQDYYTSN